MPYREIIAVCSEIHTKHINTLCGQNVGFITTKYTGTFTNPRCFTDYRLSSTWSIPSGPSVTYFLTAGLGSYVTDT